ncbi:hypothetical protein [Reinekea marinisedimentorum]|uniref:O-antigen ligase-like membrane protein n=1 Tax=Reinekea marinisedimentorum TaxID=230495 RepID=A0A4R3HY06_9GAMM|nr:hypothetical protein [Reinekea marinisedimentorum]TCS37171.1 hypothetical protein BCF53_12030 [Reinekea marinisedimentorum]
MINSYFAKFESFVFVSGVIVFLFLTETTAESIGIDSVLLPKTFLVALFCFIAFLRKGSMYFSANKSEFYIVFVGFFCLAMRVYADGYSGFKLAFFFIIFPPLISAAIRFQYERRAVTLRNLLILFYLIECFLAIYERAVQDLLFPYFTPEDIVGYIDIQTWQFRSNSLLGHPLNNALIVSTFIGFILASHNLSISSKLVLSIIGFLSILSFNARGAAIMGAFNISLFIFNQVRKRKGNPLILISFLGFSVVLILTLFFSIIHFDIGGRLFNSQLIDASALARIDSLFALKYLSPFELFFGDPSTYSYLTYRIGAAGVENSLIVIILRFGVVIVLPLVICWFGWIVSLISNNTSIGKLHIITSFFGVGMMNNSLSSFEPWVMFVLCTYAFVYSKRVKGKFE